MACCFEKAKTSVAIKGRYKVIPCTTLICTKAAAIRPAMSYFELFNLPRLREVWTHPNAFAWFDTIEACFPDPQHEIATLLFRKAAVKPVFTELYGSLRKRKVKLKASLRGSVKARKGIYLRNFTAS